jgi:hypothetical protein
VDGLDGLDGCQRVYIMKQTPVEINSLSLSLSLSSPSLASLPPVRLCSIEVLHRPRCIPNVTQDAKHGHAVRIMPAPLASIMPGSAWRVSGHKVPHNWHQRGASSSNRTVKRMMLRRVRRSESKMVHLRRVPCFHGSVPAQGFGASRKPRKSGVSENRQNFA